MEWRWKRRSIIWWRRWGSKKRACVVDDRVVEGVGGAALKVPCLKILDKATL